MSHSELYELGIRTRREVLGDEYVDRALAQADEFARPMQEMVTENCWGALWNRPGISRAQRSIINLAMLSALNRAHELKIHIRAAVGNGVTREEIREVFLQVAVYCGVPVGLESFRHAREVFSELDAEAEL